MAFCLGELNKPIPTLSDWTVIKSNQLKLQFWQGYREAEKQWSKVVGGGLWWVLWEDFRDKVTLSILAKAVFEYFCKNVNSIAALSRQKVRGKLSLKYF